MKLETEEKVEVGNETGTKNLKQHVVLQLIIGLTPRSLTADSRDSKKNKFHLTIIGTVLLNHNTICYKAPLSVVNEIINNLKNNRTF